MGEVDNISMKIAIRNLIEAMGYEKEDVKTQYEWERPFKDPNFADTPQRVVKMWERFLTGFPKPELKGFPTNNKKAIIFLDHTAWGFCPHHLLPVRYSISIGYLTDGFALGASKLPRLAEYHVSKLPLQEDLAYNIAEDLQASLEQCKGAACFIRGWHLCYVMRGVKSETGIFETEHFTGDFCKTEYKLDFMSRVPRQVIV